MDVHYGMAMKFFLQCLNFRPLACVLGLALAGVASAATIDYGGPTDPNFHSNGGGISGDCTPYCTTEYQQLFNPARFSGPVTINSITFHGSYPTLPGTFTFELSTSPVSYTNPSSTFASNFGTDTQVFYTGSFVPNTAGMSVFLGTPFTYDPAKGGSLLLDITDTQRFGGPFGTYYSDFNTPDPDAFSRVFTLTGSPIGNVTSGYGDFISFGVTPLAAAPEPSSVGLFGTAVAGFVLMLRRRRGA